MTRTIPGAGGLTGKDANGENSAKKIGKWNFLEFARKKIGRILKMAQKFWTEFCPELLQ